MAQEIPPSLQPIAKYLRKAREMQKADPVVAYYCRVYAVDQGLRIRDKADKKATMLLSTVMDQMERDKVSLGSQLGEDGRLHMENFAADVFKKADDIDRAGLADRSTAKIFYAAAQFFDVLKQFGELPSEFASKRKYALWKAADINGAIQRGEKPKPGPPGGELAEDIPYAEGYAPQELPPAPFAGADAETAPIAPVTVTRQYSEPVVVEEDSSRQEDVVDYDALLDAEKQTKIALSALQFQDPEAALRALHTAIDILQKRRR